MTVRQRRLSGLWDNKASEFGLVCSHLTDVVNSVAGRYQVCSTVMLIRGHSSRDASVLIVLTFKMYREHKKAIYMEGY